MFWLRQFFLAKHVAKFVYEIALKNGSIDYRFIANLYFYTVLINAIILKFY